MMDRHASDNNRLLAALPPADFGLLAPDLHAIPLEQGAVLMRAGERISHISFPHGGTIAYMIDMPNGETVSTAVIGREGAIGVLSVLGPARSSVTAIVRVAGAASQISTARFHAAYERSEHIKRAVAIHTSVLLAQFQQVAACNALHSVESRMACWLLHIHDRIGGNVIPLTQEVLSQLLGVRRTTATLVLHKLRESGAIRSERRGLIEIDRLRLEEASCECYEVVRGKIDRLVPQRTTGHRVHAVPAGESTGV